MTDLTRRDALMLTAVIAAATSTVQVAQAQTPPAAPPPTPNNGLLIPPVNTIASSSIPITVNIPENVFSKGGETPTKLTIAMTMSDGVNPDFTVFTTTLQGLALPAVGAKSPISPIVLMTRLKIPSDQKSAVPAVPAPAPASPIAAAPDQAKKIQVTAAIAFTYGDSKKNSTITASQPITVKVEDCALSDVSLLRLSLQPVVGPANAALTIRAVVPPISVPKGKTRQLATITCSNVAAAPAAPAPVAPAAAKPAPARADLTPYFNLDVGADKGAHLSDEVFVGFTLYPDSSGPIVMNWAYQGTVNDSLAASAYTVVAS
jgi:hypothetical protein